MLKKIPSPLTLEPEGQQLVDYGEGPFEWHGLFGRPEAALQHMRGWGRIVTTDDYVAMAEDLVRRLTDELAI